MKQIPLLLALTFVTGTALAQSKFTVGNSGLTRIVYRDVGGAFGEDLPVQSIPAMGGDHFAALYLGPAGAPDNALVKSSADAKIGVTPAVAGIFSLGTVTIPGVDAGVSVQAQVRAWRASDPGINGRNQSKTFSSKISPPVVLFGTGPNQLGGFYLIPEPAGVALISAALGGLCWMRRRAR